MSEREKLFAPMALASSFESVLIRKYILPLLWSLPITKSSDDIPNSVGKVKSDDVTFMDVEIIPLFVWNFTGCHLAYVLIYFENTLEFKIASLKTVYSSLSPS